MSVNATRAGLTSLSLKCKNDIQIIPIVFTDPERQNHLRTAQNSSWKQTSDLHTGKKWPRLCFSLLFTFISWCQGSLTFALWHFRRRDTWASVSSLQQHQICFGLHLWCVDLSQCVRRADRSAQASHWSVWGDKWKKDRHGRRSVWERCCPGDCVGLPGWQAVAAVFSLLDMEKKRWKLGGYQKKIEA